MNTTKQTNKKIESILLKLIRYKSVFDNPNETRDCVNWVKVKLKNSGFKTKVYKSGGKLSLIAAPKLKKHYKLILSGHLDVVPGSDNLFTPKIIKGKMYGRGTSDMKGAIAVMVNSFTDHYKKYKEMDAALVLTTDEEIGGFNGVNFLLDKNIINADCVFLPDTTRSYKLLEESKGVFHIKITSKGVAAHGSVPWKGENAILKLINAYHDLAKNLDTTKGGKVWGTSVNLGKIEGGKNTNSVPDFAQAFIDVRYPSGVTEKDLTNKVDKILKKHKVTWEKTVTGLPLKNNMKLKYFEYIKDVVKKYTGKLPEIIKENGASDGRFFSQRGVPVVMINPMTSPAHIEGEWIDLRELQTYYNIVTGFMNRVLSKDN
ncbi:MAG: M20 family metallopeptidase [Microgenomates group bacterium]